MVGFSGCGEVQHGNVVIVKNVSHCCCCFVLPSCARHLVPSYYDQYRPLGHFCQVYNLAKLPKSARGRGVGLFSSRSRRALATANMFVAFDPLNRATSPCPSSRLRTRMRCLADLPLRPRMWTGSCSQR